MNVITKMATEEQTDNFITHEPTDDSLWKRQKNAEYKRKSREKLKDRGKYSEGTCWDQPPDDTLLKQRQLNAEYKRKSREKLKERAKHSEGTQRDQPPDVLLRQRKLNAEYKRKSRDKLKEKSVEDHDALAERRKSHTLRRKQSRANQLQVARNLFPENVGQDVGETSNTTPNVDHTYCSKSRQKCNASCKRQTVNAFLARQTLDEINETLVTRHNVGRMSNECSQCGSLMFKGEKSGNKFSLCCGQGNVTIPPVKEPPELLRGLLTGRTQRDRLFQQHIRAYNSSLAFASMLLTGREYKFPTAGPYCYRINGQVYHALSQLQPESGKTPGFSQIYIYDQENELDIRLNTFKDLDRTLLKDLQDMIKDINPYAQMYTHVGNILKQKPSEDVKLVLKATRQTIDPRRYNLPSGTDVAVIIPSDNNNLSNRDVVIYKSAAHHPQGHSLTRISAEHPMYDPLMYVLMFPFGDKGWELGCHQSKNRQGKKFSAMQFYRYRLMVRGGDTFNLIHRMGRLLQQYIVDMYVKIEGERLRFLKYNQKAIRAELYQGLADAVQNSDGNVDGSQIGKRVVLPSSFTGSACYQHQLYQDAMGLVRRFGKPDLFVTFTCNPRWQEITDELFPGQTAADRPDLVARVFKLKLHALLQDLYFGYKPVLGKMVALIYVIEWQKRGPPHAHILSICDEESKPRTAEDYDKIVCAEIPDDKQFPDLNKIVTSLMMHGPCGTSNPKCPCMIDGACSKKFPKEFVQNTLPHTDGYPRYRRRQDGRIVIKNGIPLDNRHVVPYNPFLTLKYNAHINVEICNSIQSCKYLYKYVYKGPDMASVSTESTSKPGQPEEKCKDEIQKFVDSRFLTASEGFWRLLSFDVHGRDPSIQRLAVHEENTQLVTFGEESPEEPISNPRNTTLLAWFKLNREDPHARKLLYHEIPEHFVWKPNNQWAQRKRGRCIGRMYTTSPSQGERHYLRMLLHHIPGAMSFKDLKVSPDGALHQTFKETAAAMGLLDDDEEWNGCMSEAALSFMPKQLRSLFVTILVFGEPTDPFSIWDRHRCSMGEDIAHCAPPSLCNNADSLRKHVDNEVLLLLQEELEMMNTCLQNFGLPVPERSFRILRIPKVIQDEMFDSDSQSEISQMKQKCLNEDQITAYNMIMEAVNNPDHQDRFFFLNAPGGYGKTFLIETLLSTVRGMGKIALAVASSGIAAELLEGGRTAHSRFKIPIPINESSVCSISVQSNDAKLMKETSLIIWDEVMMSHVHQIDCVDRSLRDILKTNQPFGGIPTVLCGDPRQILPIVRHGTRAHIVKACLHSSLLWHKMVQIKLTQNMRLRKDEVQFSSFLLSIGDGTIKTYDEQGEDMIQVPDEYLVKNVEELIEKVFPRIEEGYLDKYYVSKRAILTPRNENVDRLNEVIMDKFPGIGETYLSADTIQEQDLCNAYPSEFLNSITLSGMPPHRMTLKVGAPVILLRNLRAGPGNGLRNGTRLIILKLGKKVLEVQIASGVNQGKCVLIPRITLAPSDTELPFTLKRRQFPLRPCFVMSTNKAQGQTLNFVGVFLPDFVFTHGQLYVALSRVRTSSAVAVYVDDTNGFTKNIVYGEVL